MSIRSLIAGAFGSRSSASIEIAAPAEVVWAVYSDVDRWPEWNTSVTRAAIEPKGPLVLGATASIKQPRFPKVVWTVDDLRVGECWRWSNVVVGSRADAGHSVTAIDATRSRVELWIVQRGLIGRPIGLLARRVTKRYLQAKAEGLKRRSEECGVRH